VSGEWTALLRGPGKGRLEAILPDVLQRQRWFGGKARERAGARRSPTSSPSARKDDPVLQVLIVDVEYVDGEPEDYVVPVTFAEGEEAGRSAGRAARRGAGHRQGPGRSAASSGVLVDALTDPGRGLLHQAIARRTPRGPRTALVGRRTAASDREPTAPSSSRTVLRGEQSNTSVCSATVLMKVLRRLEEGSAPTSRSAPTSPGFAHVPSCSARSTVERGGAAPRTLAMFQRFVPNEGDAWSTPSTSSAVRRARRLRPARRRPSRTSSRERPARPRCAAGGSPSGPRRDRPVPRLGRLLGRAPPSCTSRSPDRRRRGLRARADDPALPAQPVPVDAQRRPAGAAGRGRKRPQPHRPGPARRGAALVAREDEILERLKHADRRADRRHPDPHPRRLPPRPGAVHRPRLRHHRLRGRAGPAARRAAAEALAAARRGRDAALAPVRDRLDAARPGRARLVTPDHPTTSCDRLARLVAGPWVSAAFLAATSRWPPGQPFLPDDPEHTRHAARRLPAREGRLRARLRDEQPPRVGRHPAHRHRRGPRPRSSTERRQAADDDGGVGARPRCSPTTTCTCSTRARTCACGRSSARTRDRRSTGWTGVHFAVWAPTPARSPSSATSTAGTRTHPRAAWRPRRVGHLGAVRPRRRQGDTYKFHIVSHHDGYRGRQGRPVRGPHRDPAADRSKVWDLDYEWGDDDWMAERGEPAGARRADAIYELHLGSWRGPEDGRPAADLPRAGRAADRPRPGELGFTHVEFLPVMEHPFYGSWGYQTTGYFAPTSRYGTPQDLKYLIDQLHQAGIGVILDWVPSHFPTDEFALGDFDGTHLYEHADPRRASTPTGRATSSTTAARGASASCCPRAVLARGVPRRRAAGRRGRLDALPRLLPRGRRVDPQRSTAATRTSRRSSSCAASTPRSSRASRTCRPSPRSRPPGRWCRARPTSAGSASGSSGTWAGCTTPWRGTSSATRSTASTTTTSSPSGRSTPTRELLPAAVPRRGGARQGLDDRQDARRRPGSGSPTCGRCTATCSPRRARSCCSWAASSGSGRSGPRALARLAPARRRPEPRSCCAASATSPRCTATSPALHEGDCEPFGFEWLDGSDWEAVGGQLPAARPRRAARCWWSPTSPRGARELPHRVPHGGHWREAVQLRRGRVRRLGVGNLGGVDALPHPFHGRSHSAVLTLPPLSVEADL
jgi:hypothetical protein